MRTRSERWQWWTLSPTRGVLELHENVTPPGLALELEAQQVAGRTLARWILSETGAVLTDVPVGLA